MMDYIAQTRYDLHVSEYKFPMCTVVTIDKVSAVDAVVIAALPLTPANRVQSQDVSYRQFGFMPKKEVQSACGNSAM